MVESAKRADAPAKWTPQWMWKGLKDTAMHYYHGSKLLAADTRIAGQLMHRMLVRRSLTRREHNLLVRVCTDIARLVPLSFFVIVPMMEFALPFAIRIFPNLLPSTFEEKHQKADRNRQLLKVRLEMAQVLEHTLEKRAHQLAKAKKRREREAAAAANDEAEGRGTGTAFPSYADGRGDAVRDFMIEIREGGRELSTDELLSVMRSFKDNVTLDHLTREQLVEMARFLGLNSYLPTGLLRFQLRGRMRKLRNEDKEIMWESVDSHSFDELRTDLRNRGLPTMALSKPQMIETLNHWLSLSQKKEIPYTLLILTNMLRFAGQRELQSVTAEETDGVDGAQRQPQPTTSSPRQVPEPITTPGAAAVAGTAAHELPAGGTDAFDVAAAQAALSSIPLAEECTKDAAGVEVEASNDEKLQSLRREEELIEEERLLAEQKVDPEALASELLEREARALDDAGDDEATAIVASKKKAMKAEKAMKAQAKAKAAAEGAFEGEWGEALLEEKQEKFLSRDQIVEIAAAVEVMASDSAVARERAEVAQIEEEREALREEIEEAKGESRTVSMLDKRVSSMLAKLKDEIQDTEMTIGEAFRSLDLDRDGMLTHAELVEAIDSLHLSKRPDAAAFRELLETIDVDHDGKVSLADFQILLKEMNEGGHDEEKTSGSAS